MNIPNLQTITHIVGDNSLNSLLLFDLSLSLQAYEDKHLKV